MTPLCRQEISARAAELQERGFIELVTKGAFSRKSPHTSEWQLTFNTCDVTGELASKAFMRCREKQNAVFKISRRGTKPDPPCRVKLSDKSLTVSSIDTVRAVSAVVAVSIQGTHIVYHRV